MYDKAWIENASARCLNAISLGKWLVGWTEEIPDTLNPFLEYYLMSTPFQFDFAGAKRIDASRIIVLGKGVQLAAYLFNRQTWLGKMAEALPRSFSKNQLLIALFDSLKEIEYWGEPEKAAWIQGGDWLSDGAFLLPDSERRIMEIIEWARKKYPSPSEPKTEVVWSHVPYTRRRLPK